MSEIIAVFWGNENQPLEERTSDFGGKHQFKITEKYLYLVF